MQWGMAHRSLFLRLLVSYIILQAGDDGNTVSGAWPPPPKLLPKCSMGTPCFNPCNCSFPNFCGQDRRCCPVDRPNSCGKKLCFEEPLGAFSASRSIPQGSCLLNRTLCPTGLAAQGDTCCPVGLASCEGRLGNNCYQGLGRCCTTGRVCPLGQRCNEQGIVGDPLCCSKDTVQCGRKCIREGTACCISGACNGCRVGQYFCPNVGCIPQSRNCCIRPTGSFQVCCPFGQRACGSKCLSNNITCCPGAPGGTCRTGTFCGDDKKSCCSNFGEYCEKYNSSTGMVDRGYCAPAGATCCSNTKQGYCLQGSYCASVPYHFTVTVSTLPLCCKIGEKICGTKCVPATTRCCGDKVCKSGYCMAISRLSGTTSTCCPLGKNCCPKEPYTTCSSTSYEYSF